MIKAATKCLRNMFSKIEVVIKGDSQIQYRGCWCDILTQDTCREKNPSSLPHCFGVPMVLNSVLSAFNFNLLSAIQLKISWRQALSGLWSDLNLGLPNRCRYVCHLRKGGDPSYDFG